MPALQFDDVCRFAANIAMQSACDRHVGIDVVFLEPVHFDFMQHGGNLVAAMAIKDGLGTIGCPYKPPPRSLGVGLIGSQLP